MYSLTTMMTTFKIPTSNEEEGWQIDTHAPEYLYRLIRIRKRESKQRIIDEKLKNILDYKLI